ncbi:hypothetical protein Tco_1276399 [Tanacetum coccineum]
MHDYRRLSDKLTDGVKIRDEYMNELRMLVNCEEILERRDDASVHSEPPFHNQQQNNQPQYITTVSNNMHEFLYLKKDDDMRSGYEMEYCITNNDMNIIWKRESRGKEYFFSVFLMTCADFHLFDDARFEISEAEGLHKGYDRMQKILSQLNQLKAKPEDEDINPTNLPCPSHSTFVSTTSASKKMSYLDSLCYSSSTYTVPSNSKTGSQRSGNVIEDVLQSFVALIQSQNEQQAYEDIDQ